ncbi:hypothetical protein EVAR_37004_1 [Eumeta japonica]|uniref:Uncharacterized protein n=1 Tax=Eumeta variegata TaxID=151549 RepID=A0A4C1WZ65_EUMVA|nr:hypothetical protein EVAR_37004_1 [Eumeta japonica]
MAPKYGTTPRVALAKSKGYRARTFWGIAARAVTTSSVDFYKNTASLFSFVRGRRAPALSRTLPNVVHIPDERREPRVTAQRGRAVRRERRSTGDQYRRTVYNISVPRTGR